MNTDTLDKMRRMRLLGMHRAFKTSLEATTPTSLTVDEMVAMLVDSEWDDRHNRTIERSMRTFAIKPRLKGLSTVVKEGWIKM